MTPKPWYREPWPWLLMAGPAIVVVAGIATAVLAVTSFDGMVADDYYKQGMGINRMLARDKQARVLGVTASVQFSADRTRVRVVLGPDVDAGVGVVGQPLSPSPGRGQGEGHGTEPRSLRLALVHPTMAASDQDVALAATGPGTYEGAMRAPRPGTMRMRLEDAEGRWRLAGDWKTADDAVRLVP